jgi:hypothetical protein
VQDITETLKQHLTAHKKESIILFMGKQAKYKEVTRKLRVELDRFFVQLPNLTDEQKDEILQDARKKAIKELSLKKKSV